MFEGLKSYFFDTTPDQPFDKGRAGEFGGIRKSNAAIVGKGADGKSDI